MSTTFLFVDGTKSDADTRRKARSHAMKGKNAGRKHPNRRKKAMTQAVAALHDPSSATLRRQGLQDNLSAQGLSLPVSPVLFPSISDDFIVPMHLKVNTTQHSQHIIKQFFMEVSNCLNPPALCYIPKQADLLGVLFNNQAAYHCTMALMGTMNRYFFGRNVLNSSIVSHLTQAVTLVNRSLDTDEATGDANIYIVTFLTVHELLNGAQDRALVHLRGLQKMVKLRGGIEDLEPNLALITKVCKTDLDVTLHFGTPPAFYRDEMLKIWTHMESFGFTKATQFGDLECYQSFKDLDLTLQQIFLDVCNVTAFFNQGHRMDPYILQETIASIGYRLIDFHPVGGSLLTNRLDSICHIGLIALTTTFIFQIGRRRLMQYELLGKHLKMVVSAGLEDVDLDVQLWILFVAGVSVLPAREESWLLMNIWNVARQGCIWEWEDAHRRISSFPWIASLHDLEARRLWNSAMRMASG